jgi:hypothetical protein
MPKPSPFNYCPNCGSSVVPGSRYCQNCGHPLAAASALPAVRASVPRGGGCLSRGSRDLLIGFVALLALGYLVGNDDDEPDQEIPAPA